MGLPSWCVGLLPVVAPIRAPARIGSDSGMKIMNLPFPEERYIRLCAGFMLIDKQGTITLVAAIGCRQRWLSIERAQLA